MKRRARRAPQRARLGTRRCSAPAALSLALALPTPLAASEPGPDLQGAWVGQDRASEAIFETLTIAEATLAWGSPENPNSGRCEAGYEAVHQGEGTTYPGNVLGPPGATRYVTVLLALEPVDCAREVRYMLFALPQGEAAEPGRAEVSTFDEHWSLTGWHNFSRLEDVVEP